MVMDDKAVREVGRGDGRWTGTSSLSSCFASPWDPCRRCFIMFMTPCCPPIMRSISGDNGSHLLHLLLHVARVEIRRDRPVHRKFHPSSCHHLGETFVFLEEVIISRRATGSLDSRLYALGVKNFGVGRVELGVVMESIASSSPSCVSCPRLRCPWEHVRHAGTMLMRGGSDPCFASFGIALEQTHGKRSRARSF